jgi:hypothetical protein
VIIANLLRKQWRNPEAVQRKPNQVPLLRDAVFQAPALACRMGDLKIARINNVVKMSQGLSQTSFRTTFMRVNRWLAATAKSPN